MPDFKTALEVQMAGIRKRKLGPGQYEVTFDEEQPQHTQSKGIEDGGKLMVGSIFINDSEVQRKWLDLQLEFLKETTTNFTHAALVFQKDSTYFDERTNLIPHPSGKGTRNSAAHVKGLQIVHKYFNEKGGEYDWFLFLDSDAFPIRRNWLPILSGMMNRNDHDIAIPIRFENLEQRLHASILLARRRALPNLNFACRKLGSDLLNGIESDVTIGDYQDKFRRKVWVLLRSNKFSVNPLLCGVYYDMFYHHCCGSGRSYNMRGRQYWSHVAPVGTDPSVFTDELMRNPKEFIGKLAGWCPENYPTEES